MLGRWSIICPGCSERRPDKPIFPIPEIRLPQGLPVQRKEIVVFKNSARISAAVIIAYILTGSSCEPTTPSINVTDFTELTLFPDGHTEPSTSYIVGRNHKFQVEVRVEFLTANANFNAPGTGVSVIWINPENGREEFASANLKSGTSNIYMYVLPGSENLELCEPYFYRWSIVYNVVSGERGVYLSEAQAAMGAKRYTSSNTLQQAMCAEPPSPWGF